MLKLSHVVKQKDNMSYDVYQRKIVLINTFLNVFIISHGISTVKKRTVRYVRIKSEIFPDHMIEREI